VTDLGPAGSRNTTRRRRDLRIAGLSCSPPGGGMVGVAIMFLQFGQAALACRQDCWRGGDVSCRCAKISILRETGEIARADWHKLLD
jgi:hypothetical protein